MNVSVIMIVVFLNTLNTLSTRHLKRKFRNDQRLGIISSEIANTKLNPMERQSFKKLKAIGNGRQNNNPNLYMKMLKIFKALPLSSQSRLKNILYQIVIGEVRWVRKSEKERKNEGYKNVCKEVRLNSREPGKESSRATVNNKSSSKLVRRNRKESGKEDNKGIKSCTKKRHRHNSTESKYKVYNVTSEDIHPNNEESKNENYGVFWPKCIKSVSKHCEGNESPNKETKKSGSRIDVKPANKGYKGGNTVEITYKPNNETLQKEDTKGRDKSVQNERPLVDVGFPSIVGVLNHKEVQNIEYSQEGNKEYRTNNTETRAESGETNTKGPPNNETGEDLFTHNKELEKKGNDTVKGPLKIEKNKNVTETIEDNNGSQQTIMSTNPSDVTQTTTNQPETTILSDSPKLVHNTNKFKIIQRILNDITPL